MCVTRLSTYTIALCFLSGCGRADRAAAPAESHADHQTPSAPAPRVDAAVRINTTAAPGPPPKGMVWVPGGTFWMGCEGCGMPDALPVHLVEVDGFWMDRTPVTNAEFDRFVKATGYVTVAERPLERKGFSRRSERDARAGVGRVHSDIATRSARQSSAVVALHAGRELETSRRARQRCSRSRRSSGRAHRVRGRARRTRRGPASGCRPKRSSSSPRAAASIAICIRGATS